VGAWLVGLATVAKTAMVIRGTTQSSTHPL
jgi:hypothetical protein